MLKILNGHPCIWVSQFCGLPLTFCRERVLVALMMMMKSLMKMKRKRSLESIDDCHCCVILLLTTATEFFARLGELVHDTLVGGHMFVDADSRILQWMHF